MFLNEKPVISNQHGALVMAFVPFLYALFLTPFTPYQITFGLAWFFLYFFSYPFFALFNKKPTARNKQWAMIYAVLSVFFALPVLCFKPSILQFLVPITPLALIQIYFAKQRDERHLLNDIAGILTFGIIGMSCSYLSGEQYLWAILIHPTLFFIATTFYIKSVARERKNPRFFIYSLASHFILGAIYYYFEMPFIAAAYLIALFRAFIIPRLRLNIKQIGLLEFPIVILFFVSLLF